MTAIMRKAALLLLAAGLLVCMSSCIMEDRTVQFVVTHETCATFDVSSQSASFTVPTSVFLADEINSALNDNNAALEDVVTARIVSLSYGVTGFTPPASPHDWQITGAVTVERNDISDGPDTLLSYTDESVENAYGKRIPAKLNKDGVDIVNRAIDAYIAGGNPVLIFTLVNGSVNPAPSALDPVMFQWRPCLVLHIITQKDTQVPDPF
ncbi:MAG: hypothetical protein ABR899_10025 [Candidatus Krumholzibacteriaceae bacterium]|jgi:hypothetical protein